MRLQKYLAGAGVASRRQCEKLILDGRVRVNGEVATLGLGVDAQNDHVTLDGREVALEDERVILLYFKPRGIVCTNSDPEGRKAVGDVFRGFKQRLFNVGRLDIDSEGLLIMTNDGRLAQYLMHPSHRMEKTYYVECLGELTRAQIDALQNGVELSDGMTAPAKVERVRPVGGGRTGFAITIHEGRNRQVRRMVEAIGHRTLRLRRERIGELNLKGMAPGSWRSATEDEIRYLDGCMSDDK